jgi:membrane-bound lytic murein transglycosylase D
MPLERFPRLASIGLLGIALAACQPGLRPITVPSPAAGDGPRTATTSSTSGVNRPRPAERSVAAPAAVGAAVDSAASGDVVMRAATSVFGDSTFFDGVADESADAEPTWDIDVRSYETHERVEHYLRLFSGTARDRMAERISRGTRYEPMIRSKMRANGMPEDLFYLALIESGYDPNAYSRAAAVGMWQFMTATGRGVGLRIDWWMDERRDPARSTDAAISFLQSLQKQFGSLYLAAAAYNGGPGRVARGLTRFAEEIGDAEGDDKFFALAEQNYLHSETKNYVPQLIAAALVAKDPEKFGLVIEQQPAYAYDSVLVEAGTSLGAVARASSIPIEQISDLNPAILRGATPPDKSVWLRVPVGLGDSATVAYGLLPAEERAAWTTVTPKKGESITALAKRHDVSRTEITAFNPGLRTLKSGAISAGQKVRVPRRDALLAARTVPDPVIERYGGSSAGVHVVKSGESLGVIGRKYGLSVSRLKSLNGLRSDRIRAGQALVVSANASTASTRTASASSATKSASTGTTTTHVVRRGESLGAIAERYKTTVSRIKTLNKLSGDRIKAGQKLVVRRS